MSLRGLIVGLIAFMAGVLPAWGQETCDWVPVSIQPQTLHELPIVPSSIQLPWVSRDAWYFDATENTLHWLDFPVGLDSVHVCFQTVVLRVGQVYQIHDAQEYDSSALFVGSSRPTTSTLTEQVFAGKKGGLVPVGFMSRSLAVGNQQNVFLNSRFQFEVGGVLSESLTLNAVLRDNQIPFEPEGNTQQLREFDRVFVEVLHKDGYRLAGGDILLKPLPGRFMQYSKQAMGVQASYASDEGVEVQLSAGQGRGRFTSQWLAVSEGVAGPYRLVGENGETYIQLVADSERVYLDGALQTRGEGNDYVIDYNTAELTFLPSVILTAASRVRVEYEYADRSYPRSLMDGRGVYQAGPWRLWAQAYRHQDDALRPYAFTASPELIESLQLVKGGGLAQVPAQDSVGFASGGIRYAKKDTLLDGEGVYFFQHSNDPDAAHWQVSFSPVSGGDYALLQNTPQGRVYVWIPPVDGMPQGTHAPVLEVPLPQQQQMVSAGLNYNQGGHAVEVEIASSQITANRYHPQSEEDAWAGWFSYVSPELAWLEYDWSVTTKLESRQLGFKEVERYRSVDFDRFWQGQQGVALGTWDLWGKVRIEGKKSPQQYVWVEQGGRHAGPDWHGFEQALGIGQVLGAWRLAGQVYKMGGVLNEHTNDWRKQDWSIIREGEYWQPGYRFREERQASFGREQDSLISSLQNWQQHEVFIKSGDSVNGSWSVGYQYRTDWQPKEGAWETSRTAQAVWGQWNPTPNHNAAMQLNGQFRWLESANNGYQPFLSGQAIANWEPWEGTRIEGNYRTQTSRELRREFVYLLVPLGQGTHTWRDQNGDGEQSLDEFVEAIFYNERQYARFYVPTTEYLPAQGMWFRGTVQLAAPEGWHKGRWWQRSMARFSAHVLLESRQKITLDSANQLLSESLQASVQGFFNRTIRLWGFEGGLFHNKHGQLLSQGLEQSESYRYYVEGRLSPWAQSGIHVRYEQGERLREAAFWEGQSWHLHYHRIEPSFRWQAPKHWRLSMGYRWQQTSNEFVANQRALFQELNGKVQWHASGQNQLFTLDMRYIEVAAFSVESTDAASFQLLEGLRPGNNWVIRGDWQRTLANGLQLNVFYEGRQVSDQGWLHAGNAQVAWVF